MELEYPGDDSMAVFKDKLDYMLRYLRTKLEDKDKEGIVISKLRKSDALRPHLEYYDRLPESHADRSFAWVSRLLDTLIENARKKKNVDSLVSANAAAPAKKSGAPGKPKRGEKQHSGEDPQTTSAAAATTGKGKGKGKGDKSSKKNDKNSKSNSGDVSGSDSDTSTKGNPGKVKTKIDPSAYCCIRHLWGLCSEPSKCAHNPHLDKPTAGIKTHFLYKKLSKKFGAPTGPGNPPPGANADDKT